jgi:hypothetical protein
VASDAMRNGLNRIWQACEDELRLVHEALVLTKERLVVVASLSKSKENNAVAKLRLTKLTKDGTLVHRNVGTRFNLAPYLDLEQLTCLRSRWEQAAKLVEAFASNPQEAGNSDSLTRGLSLQCEVYEEHARLIEQLQAKTGEALRKLDDSGEAPAGKARTEGFAPANEDGPREPSGFRYGETSVSNIPLKPWKILAYLWQKGSSMSESAETLRSAPVSAVKDHVWPDDCETDDSLNSAVRHLNRQLKGQSCELRVRRKNDFLSLTIEKQSSGRERPAKRRSKAPKARRASQDAEKRRDRD